MVIVNNAYPDERSQLACRRSSGVVCGLIPILATPFLSDGSLDQPSLRRLVDFQLVSEVDGLAVFGMASEGFALTMAERRTILRQVLEIVGETVPVVAGVGSTSTATALEQARQATTDGARHLMVLPPFMVKPSPSQIVDFYGCLGEFAVSAGAEVMVQDAPSAAGVAMSPTLITELSKLDGVASVKVEASPTVPKVGAVVDPWATAVSSSWRTERPVRPRGVCARVDRDDAGV